MDGVTACVAERSIPTAARFGVGVEGYTKTTMKKVLSSAQLCQNILQGDSFDVIISRRGGPLENVTNRKLKTARKHGGISREGARDTEAILRLGYVEPLASLLGVSRFRE